MSSIEKQPGAGLCRRVYDYISEHGLLAPGEKVVLGFSGGPDSVALLKILSGLSKPHAFHLEIIPAHMNHALRGPAADADQVFCKNFAAAAGLKLVTETIPVSKERRRGESVEDAGRRLRYDFLRRVAEAEGAGKIAVAHHADDLAETLLLRLLRGCGLYGLAAMAPGRPVHSDSRIFLVRPLLAIRKAELTQLLESEGETYCTDHSNADNLYRRNSLRAHLLPELQEAFSGTLIDRLASVNSLAVALRTSVGKQADVAWRETVSAPEDGKGLVFSAEAMQALDRPVRTEIFRRAVRALTGCFERTPDLKRMHWDTLDAMLCKSPGHAESLPGGIRARREHGSLLLFEEKGTAREEKGEESMLAVPGQSGPVAGGVRISASVVKPQDGGGSFDLARVRDRWFAHLDLDKVEMPLSVRTRRPGDRFFPLGAPGHRKLKRFFIDRKIPLHKREKIPLVIDGGGRIIWVVGEEIADFCKLTGFEKKALVLRVVGA